MTQPAPAIDPARPVPVRLKDGRLGTVPYANLGDAVQGGAEQLTHEQYREAVSIREKSNSALSGAVTGAEGFARGFTGGLSDIAAVEGAGLLGGEETKQRVKQHLREEKAANPYLAGAGELGGVATSFLLPGLGEADAAEEAAAAPDLVRGVQAIAGEAPESHVLGALKLAATPNTAAAAAGDLAERTAANTLGHGTAARLTAKTVSGAVQGGLYGAEQNLDEQVLGDEDLNAQKLYTAAGYGALAGGATSLAVSGTAELAKRGLAAASPSLRKAAAEQAVRALSPTLAITKEIQARAGGIEAVGETLLNRDVIPREGSALERALTPEDLAPRVESALGQVGREIGEVTEGTPARVPMADVMGAFDKQIDRLESTAATAPIADSVKKEQERFLSKVSDAVMTTPQGEIPSIPIADLIRERRGLQTIAFEENKALGPKLRVQALREITGIWGDLEEKALDDASSELGGAEGQKLRALNKEYQHLKIAEKALDRSEAAQFSNRAISLSDYMTGLTAGGAALAAGHPVAAAGGFLSSLAHKYVRERGNSLAASYLDKLSQLGALQRTLVAVDKDTTKAIDAFVANKQAPALENVALPPYRGAALQKRFNTALDATESAPDSVEIRHAPGIAKALRGTALRAQNFLLSKIPEPAQPDPYSLTPQLTPRKYSEHDMQAFMRYYDAAKHPGILATELAQGKVHPETVEAVKAVAPGLFAEMQQKVMEACSRLDSPLSYDQKLQLGILFERPTHWSLDPAFVFALQQTKAPPPAAAPKKGGGGAKGRAGAKLNTSMFATTAEEVQAGTLHKGQ